MRLATLAFLLAVPGAAVCQSVGQIDASDQLLDGAMKLSLLTHGHTAFHTILTAEGPGPAYSATIELWWLAPQEYRLKVTSPGFKQVKVVNHELVSESDEGDFLPKWLDNLVSSQLEPINPAQFSRRSGASIPEVPNDANGFYAQPCIKRDDRPGGITDQLTWGLVCFYPGGSPHLRSVLTFSTSLEFKDFHNFHGQDIPYTLQTDVLDFKPVIAHRTVLEELGPVDPGLFAVEHATPPAERVQTDFVSTLKEESLIDRPPTFKWPTVREGRTEGYMIVYARTDWTGQVRETAKHNSDNPGLEQFGMEQALTLKFHPLVVDGVAQQMEMPLVLHFKTTVADPLPYLSDTQTRQQITGCSLPHVEPGEPSYRWVVSVNEEGKLTGETNPDANNLKVAPLTSFLSLRTCRFAPYKVKGKPSYYHGELILPR